MERTITELQHSKDYDSCKGCGWTQDGSFCKDIKANRLNDCPCGTCILKPMCQDDTGCEAWHGWTAKIFG